MNSNWSYSPEALDSGQNRWFSWSDLEIFDRLFWKTIGHLFYASSSFVHRFKAIGDINLDLQSGNGQFRSKSAIFCPCDLEGHIFYAASSFVHHFIAISEFKLVRKHLIRVKIDNFFSHVTLKFDRWPWKSIGHLSLVTPSFVYHFTIICEFKLELQSGNAKFGSPWGPWKTIGHLFYATSSFVHRFKAIGEFKLELQSGIAKFGSKSTIFFSCVTLKFDGWPWKAIGHLS